MNKQSIVIVMVLIICFSIVIASNMEYRVNETTIIELKPKTSQISIEPNIEIIDMSMGAFLEELALKESSGDWKVVNRYGYIGLFQFGKSALRDVGYKHIKTNDFIENPHIFPPEEQYKAVKQLLKKNTYYLRKYLKYDGTVVGGVHITMSGMLAAAHLVGNKGVRIFLKSKGKDDRCDANGVKCSDYLKHFKGYYINLN